MPAVLQPRSDGRNTGGQNCALWSTSNMRVAVTIGEDDGVYFSKAPADSRGNTGPWQIRKLGTGTTAAAEIDGLNLPQQHDNHKWHSICVQESSQKVIISGNMWQTNGSQGQMRLIETINSVSPTTPIAGDTFWRPMGAEPPGVPTILIPGTNYGWTYPMFAQFADGTLMWTLRGGATGDANSYMWVRPPGANVWTLRTELFHGRGMTVPFNGDTKMSAYHNAPFIEGAGSPHPDRLHYTWIWRGNTGSGGEAGVGLLDPFISYMYSDDKGVTWKNILNQTVTTPIEPMTQTQVHMNSLASPVSTDPYWPYAQNANGAGLSTLSGLTIDGLGFPHATASSQTATGQQAHFWWDGAHWQWEAIGGATLTGHGSWFVFSRCVPVYADGSVWAMCVIGNSRTGLQGPGRLGCIELGVPAGTARVNFVGGNIYRDGLVDNSTYGQGTPNVGFVPLPEGTTPDPEARRRFGRIEWNIPQGTTPFVRALARRV